ncbi:MAG: 16S rRNA (guanine(966)-N(2))-methyltransferase RsmD [bacterium]|nr:16S rRNA (guanine(966)-N(2))-methyltransferase RsmD [bacterium]
MIKVISGMFKGRVIHVKNVYDLRPLQARVKKSMFDIIKNKLPGSKFLDLFAGSGSVGIEAISRGASYVVFVEINKKYADGIVKVLEKFGVEKSKYEVIVQDVFEYLEYVNQPFDIIFSGAPYEIRFGRNFSNEVLSKINAKNLKKDGVLILQHHVKENIVLPYWFDLKRRNKYGENVLDFIILSGNY